MGETITSVGDALITIGATLTLWVSLPILFALGIRECFKKNKELKK